VRTLIIIESPGKKAKLEHILGDGYTVRASYGHVRDLPDREMGVAAPNYRPRYVVAGDRAKSTIASLQRAAATADRVLLATDPDREGEAIAWHIAEVLKLRQPQRITYSEISAKAVNAALAAPRPIDMHLVQAQEARRVLDRLVGYQVSPAVSGALGEAHSAGRVQSPALRLLVDHERAIRSFVSTTHYQVDLHFAGATPWKARWHPALAEGSKYWLDAAAAARAADPGPLRVAAFADSTASVVPPAPFTTSTLQQTAQKRLKLKPKTTMELAQSLYEAGAITYMRTDSPNLSDDACASIEEYARSMSYPLPDKRRRWKAKGGAQEAHEAIRPTDIHQADIGANESERELYRLIWKRTLASQLADATFAVRTAELHSLADQSVYVARGRTLIDPGWKFILDEGPPDPDDDEDAAGASSPVPALFVGAELDPDRGEVLTRRTKPPKRYTQADLTRALEARGIGRPATFVSIFQTLSKRQYVIEDKKGLLSPTPTAERLIDRLVDTFGFLDYDYTTSLESGLDEVSQGKISYLALVSSANQQLLDELSSVQPAASHLCPSCAQPLRRLLGKRGPFWGCSGYPTCKATFPDHEGSPLSSSAVSEPHFSCPSCQVPLRRNTRSKSADPKGRGWDFWSCPSRQTCPKTYQSSPDGSPFFPSSS